LNKMDLHEIMQVETPKQDIEFKKIELNQILKRDFAL